MYSEDDRYVQWVAVFISAVANGQGLQSIQVLERGNDVFGDGAVQSKRKLFELGALFKQINQQLGDDLGVPSVGGAESVSGRFCADGELPGVGQVFSLHGLDTCLHGLKILQADRLRSPIRHGPKKDHEEIILTRHRDGMLRL